MTGRLIYSIFINIFKFKIHNLCIIEWMFLYIMKLYIITMTYYNFLIGDKIDFISWLEKQLRASIDQMT